MRSLLKKPPMNPKTHPKKKKIKGTLLANLPQPKTGMRSILATSPTWLRETENRMTL
jgi:hypothetical protein